jgi:hypothetical protein
MWKCHLHGIRLPGEQALRLPGGVSMTLPELSQVHRSPWYFTRERYGPTARFCHPERSKGSGRLFSSPLQTRIGGLRFFALGSGFHTRMSAVGRSASVCHSAETAASEPASGRWKDPCDPLW